MKQDCRVLEMLRASLPSCSARPATPCFFRTFSASSQPVPKLEAPSCHTCVSVHCTQHQHVYAYVCAGVYRHTKGWRCMCVYTHQGQACQQGLFRNLLSNALTGALSTGSSPPSCSLHQSGHTAAPTWPITQQDRGFTPRGWPLS